MSTNPVTTDWSTVPLNGFDTETTGIDATTDRIVTASYVEIRPGRRPVTRKWVVDPGIDIPDGAAQVHGYTRERAAAEATCTPEQMLFEITGLLALGLGHDIPVVAFNAAYDLTILETENRRHSIDSLQSRMRRGAISPVVDPMVLDKKFSRRRGSRKLVDVCAHYGVIHSGAHDATGDALAACRLVPKVMGSDGARKAKVATLQPVILHQAQVGWRREQMDSLRSYFDSKGTAHDGCDGGWPVLDKATAALTAGAA